MKKIFTIASLLLAACTLYAQEKEDGFSETTEHSFGGRAGVTLGYKPLKSLDLSLSEELRADTRYKGFDRSMTTLSVKYSPFKSFNIIAEYGFVARLRGSEPKTMKYSHRGKMGVSYTVKMGDFRLQLRELVQCDYKMDSVNVKEEANPALYLRSRLRLSYHVPHLPLTPYIAGELYNTLNQPYIDLSVENTTKGFREACLKNNIIINPFRNYVSRVRAVAGLEYDFNRHSSIKLYYLYNYDITYDVNYGKSSKKINRIEKETGHRHNLGLEYVYYF